MIEEELKKRCVTEGQVLFEFMRDDPEYVRQCVAAMVRRLVEEQIDRKRDELEARVDAAIKQALVHMASQEFFRVLWLSDGHQEQLKPLEDEVRERAHRHIANLMRIQFETTMEVKKRVEQLEERIERDDADWWKRGGESDETPD